MMALLNQSRTLRNLLAAALGTLMVALVVVGGLYAAAKAAKIHQRDHIWVAEQLGAAPPVDERLQDVAKLLFLSQRETHLADELLFQAIDVQLTDDQLQTALMHLEHAAKYRETALEAVRTKARHH